MTPLDNTVRRSLIIKGLEYVLSFSPDALKITRKGRRLGLELRWQDLISGESALAVALHASVGRFEDTKSSSPPVVKTPNASLKRPKAQRSAASPRGGSSRRRRS